jgi:hypothetical protein
VTAYAHVQQRVQPTGSRGTTQLAVLLWVLAIIPASFTIGLSLLVNTTNAGLSLLTLVLYPTIGALIAARRPKNPLGWLFCGIGISTALAELGETYILYTSTSGVLPAERWFEWLSNVLNSPGVLTGATFTFLLFPGGKLLSRRWQLLAWLTAASSVVNTLHQGLAVDVMTADNGTQFRNPLYVTTIARILQPIQPIAFAIGLLALVGAILSLGLRLRRSRGVERQQLKWFVYVAALSVTSFLLAGMCASIDPETQGGFIGGFFWITALLGIELGLPAVVGLAILRYRLYEIDRLINRTLVYAVLTASLALIYLGLVIGLGALMRTMTDASSNLVVVASTLAVAGLFQPFRSRIQTTVDRRFYRHKYDATRTLEAFSARLRDEIDLAALSTELQATVVQTMQPAHVSLWLRDGLSNGLSG